MLLAAAWRSVVFALWSLLAGVVMAPALIIQSMLVAKTARPGAHDRGVHMVERARFFAGVGLGLARSAAIAVETPAVALAAFAAAALSGADRAPLAAARLCAPLGGELLVHAAAARLERGSAGAHRACRTARHAT